MTNKKKKKKPTSEFDPKTAKVPRNKEEPAQYKDWPISWQLSYIDNESRWGINVLKNHTKLKDQNTISSILKELEGLDDEIMDEIIALEGKKFDSLKSFLDRLASKTNNSCTLTQVIQILQVIEENIFWKELYDKIRHFEGKTWLEIENEKGGKHGSTNHHSIKVSNIIPDAQKRLEIINMNDVDELFSIRISGKKRVFGIRLFSYLQVLWIDLEHEICPSIKKNT